ncbi:MAG TPA: T9SS type A sorting domain-containing protein, partial [Saprospiraceae bacterium]|nr:T9SS type A sorting domain-containing protein [Saprospiraceae bacterium]
SGAYYFSVHSDIGIIGSAAPFGWDADVNMFQDSVHTDEYSLNLNLGAGEVKFRQDDDWAVNWGAADFPSGIGVQNGPNIPITTGGTYNVTFNKATGAYNFALTSFPTVGIIGSATPGGSNPTPLNSASGVGNWTLNAVLLDGGLQFVGDTNVAIWGGTEFPSGTATLNGPEIPVTAGRYIINFNSTTLAYSFTPIVYYATVGIIGNATAGGWDADTDMNIDPTDSSWWNLRTILTDGELKFRADNDWAVNWGGATFPSGVAERDGPNIPIVAGDYTINFNTFTGEYFFVEHKVFSSMGLIGTGTPFGEWTTDVPMEKDALDENLWKIQSVNLSTGEIKFRAEGAWTFNWGAVDWPTGTGTQDGPNIPSVAGTYGVTLNSNSGEYAFGDPLVATQDLLNPASVLVYPNPAKESLNIDISAADLQGTVLLRVYDISGQLIHVETQPAAPQMQMNVSGLGNGYYMLNISNDKKLIGKKFSILR